MQQFYSSLVAQPTSDLVRSYKMTIEIKEITDLFNVTKEIVFIYDGNGGCTQIDKTLYDEQLAQAEQSTPSV